MSKPFKDLNLSDSQINSNYTWKQIKTTQNYIDDKVFVDAERQFLAVSNKDNNLDKAEGLDKVTMLGNSITTTNTQKTVVIGHDIELQNVNGAVIIGGDRNEAVPDKVYNTTDGIIIGHNLDCGTLGPVNAATLIGHDSVLTGGGNTVVVGNDNTQTVGGNILIGHDLVDAGMVNTNMLIMSNGQLNTEPVSGSVVFGGTSNFDVSASSNIQFLSTGLSPAGLPIVIPVYDENDVLTGEYVFFNGTIPIKYRDQEVLIPFILP